jgi:hypothetical protein
LRIFREKFMNFLSVTTKAGYRQCVFVKNNEKPLETKGKLLTNVRMCGILKVEIVKSTIDIS